MDRNTLHSLMVQAGMEKIKATGEGFAALCPFHDNKKSPAWGINSTTMLWKCWNPDCGKTGNFTTFLVDIVGMSYTDAEAYKRNIPEIGTLEADEWGLPDYADRNKQEESTGPEERILGLYAKCPRYMLDRGFPKRFLQEFDIGFDTEANRVTFPVRSVEGKLLGFTRRAVDDSWPKYLHDFDKTQTMYLAHTVRSGLPLVVTEGSIDALMARLRGRQTNVKEGFDAELKIALGNTVATLGSGLQVDVIAKLEPSAVFLGFDLWQTDPESGERTRDKAGANYTRKAITALHEVGISDIYVLDFPSDDLGALALSDLPALGYETSIKWLWKQPR